MVRSGGPLSLPPSLLSSLPPSLPPLCDKLRDSPRSYRGMSPNPLGGGLCRSMVSEGNEKRGEKYFIHIHMFPNIRIHISSPFFFLQTGACLGGVAAE